MSTVETIIVLILYCIQYAVQFLLISVAVGLLISGLDWFMDRLA